MVKKVTPDKINGNYVGVHCTYQFIKEDGLTINAPLILKMRDIIFFCGQTT